MIKTVKPTPANTRGLILQRTSSGHTWSVLNQRLRVDFGERFSCCTFSFGTKLRTCSGLVIFNRESFLSYFFLLAKSTNFLINFSKFPALSSQLISDGMNSLWFFLITYTWDRRVPWERILLCRSSPPSRIFRLCRELWWPGQQVPGSPPGTDPGEDRPEGDRPRWCQESLLEDVSITSTN